MLTRFSFDPKWHSFKLELEIIKTNILSKIHEEYFKNVTSRVLARFYLLWPCDLVFYLKWPIFVHDLEIIKTNIWSKIYDVYFKTVTSRLLTKFFFNLASWPSFWPPSDLDSNDIEIIKTNILSKSNDDSKKVTSSVNKIFLWFARLHSILPKINQFRTRPGCHWGKHSEQVSLKVGLNCTT